MKQGLSPAVTGVIIVIALIVIGLIGWKYAFKPKGVTGSIPASASNPNGYTPPPPSPETSPQPGRPGG